MDKDRLKKSQTTLTESGFLENLMKLEQKMKNERMKNRFKRLAVAITAIALLMPAPASAWVDGAALAQRGIEFAATTIQRAKELIQWKAELENWKANLKNYIRGRISKILGINLTDKFTMEDLRRLLQKRKARCASLGNSQSRALCNETLDIEIKKVNVYEKMDEMIKQSYTELEKMVNEYERIRGGQNTSGKAASKQEEISAYIQNFENKLKIYEQQLKMLDMQQDMLQKARVEVAKDQIRSTNTARTVAQAAVIGTLKYQSHDYQKKAGTLHNENAVNSNKNYIHYK